MQTKLAPVSVIIPYFNGSKYIDQAVQSVFQQSLKPEQIIIINDGSEANESHYLDKFKDTCTLIQQKNKGPSIARNVGIDYASTEWIAFLDQDDWWEEDKLLEQFAFIKDKPACHAIHTAVRLESDTAADTPKIYRKKALTIADFLNASPCPSYNSSMLVKRQSLYEVGLFNPYLWMSQDHELYLRIADFYGIEYVDKPLTIRRSHGNNLSENYMEVWREAYTIICLYKNKYDNDQHFKKRLTQVHAKFMLISLYKRNFKRFFKIVREARKQNVSLIRLILAIQSQYKNDKK